MMKEVESGKVRTILIKDMSRMGRDYLKVGQYMELLRQKNVRLIAVNENVDSFREDDDFTPFRNIMNEWYARDILDDEKEARSYFDQLWAEVMEIYWSTENKSSLLKFSKEMEQEISEYRKQFTQEDTMAGMIQGWLDAYKGSHVCSVQIWKEAFDHFDREPKKFETNEICSIMDTQITGWKRAGVHRFSKEGYGRQRSWIREGAEEEGGNEPDKDGFTKLTKAEQLELPFDLPDREKG